MEERNATGGLVADYVYGPGIDEVLTMTRGANTYYYFYDALGSVRQITNAAGTISETYDYDVFGKPLNVSALGNPVMFTGRWFDSESGNFYYRARYYQPTLGRFLQRDPIGYLDGMNLYAYVSNNALNYFDPSGEGKIFTAIKILGKGVKAGRAITKDVAKRIFRKQGGDILVSRKLARQLAKSKGKLTKSGKKFIEEKHGAGESHIHPASRMTELGKKSGHAFLYSLTAVAIFGNNAFAQTLDMLNPVSDLIDAAEFLEDPEQKFNDIFGEDEAGEDICTN